MGLFGSKDDDKVNDEVEKLIDNAKHESVNVDRLTKLKKGMMTRYLYDDRLIDYLNDGEQPHFILAARSEDPSSEDDIDLPETDNTGMVMYLITDERWVTVAGSQHGDQFFEISLEDITSVDYSTGFNGHEINLGTKDGIINFQISNGYDSSEVKAASNFLKENISTIDRDVSLPLEAIGEKSWDNVGIDELQRVLEKYIRILDEENGQFVNVDLRQPDGVSTWYQIGGNKHGNIHNITVPDGEVDRATELLESLFVSIDIDEDGSGNILVNITDDSPSTGAKVAAKVLEEIHLAEENKIDDLSIVGIDDAVLRNKIIDSKSEHNSENVSPGGIELEAGIAGHNVSGLNTTGELPPVVAHKKDTETNHSILNDDTFKIIYEYKYVGKITVDENMLNIGELSLDLKNILNVRFLENRTLKSGGSSSDLLHGCDYIALTVATEGLQPESSGKDYEGAVSEIYIVGGPNDIKYHGTAWREDDRAEQERSIVHTPEVTNNELRKLYDSINGHLDNKLSNVYILQDYIEQPSHLIVEGWQESGVTNINAGIEGSTENKGKSRGFQIGPYTSSRSKSEGSITAELDGSIADSSFSSEINFLHISENGIFVDSDPVLDFDYGEIDRILTRDNGFTIEVGETAYTVVGPQQLTSMSLGKDGNFKELDSPATEDAIRFVQQQIQKKPSQQDQDENSNEKPKDGVSDKLRELKELKDDGILTDEEFRSKKEELLDDF